MPRKSMVKLAHPDLEEAVGIAGNDFCADCKSRNPKWASVNLGVVVCIECSGHHRNLGVHISQVRSMTLDKWKPEWIQTILKIGNKISNSYYEYSIPDDYTKPAPGDRPQSVEQFIRAKYEAKRFAPPGCTEPHKLLAAGGDPRECLPTSGDKKNASNEDVQKKVKREKPTTKAPIKKVVEDLLDLTEEDAVVDSGLLKAPRERLKSSPVKKPTSPLVSKAAKAELPPPLYASNDVVLDIFDDSNFVTQTQEQNNLIFDDTDIFANDEPSNNAQHAVPYDGMQDGMIDLLSDPKNDMIHTEPSNSFIPSYQNNLMGFQPMNQHGNMMLANGAIVPHNHQLNGWNNFLYDASRDISGTQQWQNMMLPNGNYDSPPVSSSPPVLFGTPIRSYSPIGNRFPLSATKSPAPTLLLSAPMASPKHQLLPSPVLVPAKKQYLPMQQSPRLTGLNIAPVVAEFPERRSRNSASNSKISLDEWNDMSLFAALPKMPMISTKQSEKNNDPLLLGRKLEAYNESITRLYTQPNRIGFGAAAYPNINSLPISSQAVSFGGSPELTAKQDNFVAYGKKQSTTGHTTERVPQKLAEPVDRKKDFDAFFNENLVGINQDSLPTINPTRGNQILLNPDRKNLKTFDTLLQLRKFPMH